MHVLDTSRVLVLACATTLSVLAFYVISPYAQDLLARTAIIGFAAFGVRYLYAEVGELSFGHGLFFGLGAYLYALMPTSGNVNAIAGFCVTGIGSFILAALAFAFLAARLRGVYFTLASLCVSEATRIFTARAYQFAGGDNGIQGLIPRTWWLAGNYPAQICIMLVLLFGLGSIMIRRTVWGRAVSAQRQSSLRASSLGINVSTVRMQAVVLSALPTLLGGFLLAAYDQAVHPKFFSWEFSGDLIAAVFLGGWRTYLGCYAGSALLQMGKALIAAHTDYWPSLLGALLLFAAFRESRSSKRGVWNLERV